MLSGDINTALRGRSIEIRVYPLSFKEYHAYKDGDVNADFRDFMLYGGLPYVAMAETEIEKTEYLRMIGDVVATKDIIERYDIKSQNIDAFSAVADFCILILAHWLVLVKLLML